MKRLIWLKTYDYNPEDKKLKAADKQKLIDKMSSDCIKQFKKDIKKFSYIKIDKEYPGAEDSYYKPSVVIDFPDEKLSEIYNDFVRDNASIETIDNVLPLEYDTDRPKEKKTKKIKKELDLSKFLK
jgi:hypothetical protein